MSEQYHNIVLFDRQEFECDTVLTIDHARESRRLCTYMLKKYPGHPLYALMGYEFNSTVRQITAGIRLSCEETGIDAQSIHLYYNCRVEIANAEAAGAVMASVRRGEKPIVICYGENFLESLMLRLAMRENNVRKKLYLAGYADSYTIGKLGFEFPRIVRDTRASGVLAAQTLMERMEDPSGERAPRLLLAESCTILDCDSCFFCALPACNGGLFCFSRIRNKCKRLHLKKFQNRFPNGSRNVCYLQAGSYAQPYPHLMLNPYGFVTKWRPVYLRQIRCSFINYKKVAHSSSLPVESRV